MTAQLSLPYLEIKEVANRKYLRDNFKQTGRASYYIEFSKIKVRENFNKRIVFDDIVELSDSIFVHGLKDPFVLDILPDGTAYIEEGHRRQKAITRLIEKGRVGWTAETLIEFFSNKSEVTELDRMVNQYTSNNNKKKLKPFEAAAVAYAAKFNFSEKPKSNEEVAELLGVSRQQVDNYILISSADDLLKNEMLTADMNLTECVALVKNKKKVEKQLDKVEEDSHKTNVAPTPLPKDDLAGEVKDLEKLNEPTPEELEEKAAQDLEELLKISDEIKVRDNTIREHIGRKLSAAIIREWVHERNNEQGEPESKDMSIELVTKNTILTEDTVSLILDTQEIDTIFVYKVGMEPIAASVITEPVAEKEKDKWDMDRVEIQQIQNCIKLADKLDGIVTRLDVPDGSKKDVSDIVKWLQKDLAEVRAWVHANKKQNKRGS